MKQCPRCTQTFPDDLNFCLEHGTPLIAIHDDDKTWVLREPVPTITALGDVIEPGPTVAAPTPERSRSWKVLSIVGLVLAICAYGAFRITLKWQEREERASENTNSSTVPFNFVPAVTTPTITPSPTLAPSPSPSPSPSMSPMVSMVSPTPHSSKPTLLPGTYQMQVKLNNRPEDAFGLRTMKMQFILNGDGTYAIQGFITIAGTDMQDRLYREERGNYSVSDDLLMFSDRLARELDRENNIWKPWSVPTDGRWASEKIRNINPTSFEINSDGRWVIVNKL